MNTTFSFKRVQQLLVKQFVENYKIYLMTLAVMVGVELFIFFIHIMQHAPISIGEHVHVHNILGDRLSTEKPWPLQCRDLTMATGELEFVITS